MLIDQLKDLIEFTCEYTTSGRYTCIVLGLG